MTNQKLEQKINNQYNAFVQTYIDNLDLMDKPSIELFYSKIPKDLKGKKVLDVGCGSGQDLLNLQKLGAKAYGIDSSEESIKNAKEIVPGADLSLGTMNELPYPDNYFDMIVSKYALQTSLDVPKALDETTRVLKENGLVIYLTKHPLRQFLEKKKSPKNYFQQETVESRIFDGKIKLIEPTHTEKEYLNPRFLKNFRILDYDYGYDFPASEQIEGDTYPCFFTIVAQKIPLPGDWRRYQ